MKQFVDKVNDEGSVELLKLYLEILKRDQEIDDNFVCEPKTTRCSGCPLAKGCPVL